MISDGNYTAGVLQVYYNGSWIDVCSDLDTGNVACRQLGFYSILGVHDDLSAIGLAIYNLVAIVCILLLTEHKYHVAGYLHRVQLLQMPAISHELTITLFAM